LSRHQYFRLDSGMSSGASMFKSKAVDKTKEERGHGVEVVDSVIRKIRRSQVFRDDYDFLKRIAFLETNFGADVHTFRDNYFGGIWQVPESFLNITKSDKLNELHKEIRSSFDIDWKSVQWTDLTKPLHSAIAIRLYIQTISENIPQTISKQGLLYEKIYNKRDASAQFIARITEFENTAEKCKGLFDLTVVLDGSGSVGKVDFEKSKDFVVKLFATYSSSDLRKGFILFGNDAFMVFPLDNNFTTPELQDIVRNVRYPSEATNTNAGIMMAVEMIQNSKPRPGVPSIMIVFTDGESNIGDGVSNIKYAKQSNITTFAIGIGARLNQTELRTIAYNDSSRVMVVHDFNTLSTLAHRLNAETCLVSHKPNLNEEVTDTLTKDEKRYYSFPMTPDGITVKVNQTEGETDGFYSFTEENPSQSVHDGLIEGETTYISPPNELLDKFMSSESTETFGDSILDEQVYITLNGKENENVYSIQVLEGDGNPKNKNKNSSLSEIDVSTDQEKLTGNNLLNNTSEPDTGNSTNTGVGDNDNSQPGLNGGETMAAGSNANGTNGDSSMGSSSEDKGDNKAGDGDSGQDKTGKNGNNGTSEDTNNFGDKNGNSTTDGQGTSPISMGDYGGLPRFSGMGFNGQRNVRCPDNQVVFQAFAGRCDLYTLCACGVKVLLECSPGLYFDTSIGACNFIQLVDCASSPYPDLIVIKNKQG
ncbi:unnamed protein product, partial [Allacma fusca]